MIIVSTNGTKAALGSSQPFEKTTTTALEAALGMRNIPCVLKSCR